MITRLKNKWWVLTILSGIFMYLDPYLGLFSMLMIIVLFFDAIMFIIMKGHSTIFSKKIVDRTERIDLIKKVFGKEIFSFKILKLFNTLCTFFVTIVVAINNMEIKKIMAPYYISSIQENFFLQLICIALALASILFSCVLFWFYAESYKEKLNEME